MVSEQMEREKMRCARDARMAHAAQGLLDADGGRYWNYAEAAVLKAFAMAPHQIAVNFGSVRPPTADSSRRQW